MNHLKKLIVLVLLVQTGIVNAQSLFKRLKDKAQQTSVTALEKAVENKLNGKPAPSVPQDAGRQASGEANDAQSAAALAEAYGKYDFVPGQTVIYSDNFENDASGELPQGWNSNGNGAVVKLNSFGGNWMRMAQQAVYLPGKNLASTDNFTVEFDVIFDLKFNGYGYPEFNFGMLAAGKTPVGDNAFLSDQNGVKSFSVQLGLSMNNNTHLRLTSQKGRASYFTSPVKSYAALEQFYGKVSHIALNVQKERLRLWINGDKLMDVPKAIPAGDVLNQLFFSVGGSNYTNDQIGIYSGNIKVAQGMPDMRNKLVNEGHFTTTGILFDVNTATIKPESNGTLNEIAQVLKDNPALKVKVTGHTDSDGNAAANQKLSLSRAESVKNELSTTYGIDASRLQVSGKGATMPVTSNKTETEKAQNRRVEFVKI